MIPEAAIFDIGNVLTRWQPEAFYDRAIGEARRRALFAAVDLHGMNQRIDAGHPFRQTVYDCAAAHPEWAAEIRLWHDRWPELATPLIDGSIRLLHALKAKGVPVFALTNASGETLESYRDELPFLAAFDRLYVSGRMGVMKPDPRIYALVEQDSGIAPDRLFFTDDRAENIAAAAARGWRTHLFDDWQGLARRLAAEGLLTQTEAAS